MIWTVKKSLWTLASLCLFLATESGLSMAAAVRPGSCTQQQAAAIQPQNTETQKAPPVKPLGDPSVIDAPVAPPPLPDAPASKPVSNKVSQQAALPEQDGNTQGQTGTAAAEAGKSTGVAASRPSGMAIAPARQRRRRSFLVKLGAVVGAGVAGGTVFALSRSSPSKPPGAR